MYSYDKQANQAGGSNEYHELVYWTGRPVVTKKYIITITEDTSPYYLLPHNVEQVCIMKAMNIAIG